MRVGGGMPRVGTPTSHFSIKSYSFYYKSLYAFSYSYPTLIPTPQTGALGIYYLSEAKIVYPVSIERTLFSIYMHTIFCPIASTKVPNPPAQKSQLAL